MLICSIRAVSRTPLPLRLISITCRLISGKRPCRRVRGETTGANTWDLGIDSAVCRSRSCRASPPVSLDSTDIPPACVPSFLLWERHCDGTPSHKSPELKHYPHIYPSRLRSVVTFFVNLLIGLLTNCPQPKKPSHYLTALPNLAAD